MQRALGALVVVVLVCTALFGAHVSVAARSPTAPAAPAADAQVAEAPLWHRACLLATDEAVSLATARQMTGWNCAPQSADFAHSHLWVRLPAPAGPLAEPLLLRADALAFGSLDLAVQLADGTLRQTHWSADQLAQRWSLGTTFAVPLLNSGERAQAVWLRINEPLDRNNAMLATYATERQEAALRERGLVLIALFCGMLLILAIYALSLSIALRSAFSLWHGAMVAFMLLYTLSSSALLHMFVPGISMWQRSATSYLSMAMSIAMIGPFLTSFFERELLPRWAINQAHAASALSALAGLGFVLLGPAFPFLSRAAFHAAFLFVLPSYVLLCLVAWRRGSVAARIALFAWSFAMVLAVDRILRGLNLYALPNDWDNSFFAALALQSMIMAGGITWRIGILRRERDLALAQEQILGRLAETDDLTGLLNRRAFEARTWRRGDYLALLDADHFKTINDRLGHQVGDQVLRALGLELGRIVAESSQCLSAYRMGGEEFAVVVSARSAEKAALQVNQVRHRLGQAVAGAVPALHLPLTISAGLAVIGEGGLADAYRAADRALYKAKNAGRDRLCYELDQSGTALIFPRAKAA